MSGSVGAGGDAAGVPIKVISERMGHSSPSVTWAVYTHADTTQHLQLAQNMGALLAASG